MNIEKILKFVKENKVQLEQIYSDWESGKKISSENLSVTRLVTYICNELDIRGLAEPAKTTRQYAFIMLRDFSKDEIKAGIAEIKSEWKSKPTKLRTIYYHLKSKRINPREKTKTLSL